MFWTVFTLLSVLLLFHLSTIFVTLHGFDTISSNIDEVLNPSAVFVFGDLTSIITYSGQTDILSELCYYFSISNNLPTWIPDCDSHSPALFYLFPPLGNSDDVVVSVSVDFLSNSKRDSPFHCIAYNYSCDDWDSPCDYLGDVPW